MEILREHPERAAECPCWDEFTPMEWMMILEVHPHFADYNIDFNLMDSMKILLEVLGKG